MDKQSRHESFRDQSEHQSALAPNLSSKVLNRGS